MATSEEFASMTANALKILKFANKMEVYEMADEIKNISAEKHNINDYLDIFQFWFRDVLMFKAVNDGKQVAYLCPTTIFSSQQFESAKERSATFPVNIALINRFVDKYLF